MKNLIPLLVIVSLLSFPGCSANRKSEPIVGRSFTPMSQEVKNGQAIFMMNCQKCHPGGEAGLGPGLNWNPAPGFIKKFQVRTGLGVMPSFHNQEIPRKDLKDLTAYLKALRRFGK